MRARECVHVHVLGRARAWARGCALPGWYRTSPSPLGVSFPSSLHAPSSRRRQGNDIKARTTRRPTPGPHRSRNVAIVAIVGMIFQSTVGTTGVEMWLPGSAFEKELGVQAPVGCFDPLGLPKDGDASQS